MVKRKLANGLLSAAAAAALVVSNAGAAQAADHQMYLYYPDGGALSAEFYHQDDGDVFWATDWESDGHGVRAVLSSRAGLADQVYVGSGYGTGEGFKFNIREGVQYFMELCLVDGPGDFTGVKCIEDSLYE